MSGSIPSIQPHSLVPLITDIVASGVPLFLVPDALSPQKYPWRHNIGELLGGVALETAYSLQMEAVVLSIQGAFRKTDDSKEVIQMVRTFFRQGAPKLHDSYSI